LGWPPRPATLARVMGDPRAQIEKQLYRRMRATIEAHHLLCPGDRVLVAISGGKDSYTMLELLARLVRRLPFEVSLVAVHLDQRQPGYDGQPLIAWLMAHDHAYEILSEDTYSVVVDKLEPQATYCSLCSRLRRGILYSAAMRLGCNKIALGHHRDDGLETFLMNLFFSGKLQAMPPKYRTDDGRLEVIRPLIECPEDLIREYARLSEFPILPCNLCGSQPNLQRDRMAALLDQLEREHPRVRSVMAAALGNVKPSHLLDARLAHLDPADDAERPRPRGTVAHAAATPVLASVRRLPLVGP
jgi:tRNA 2-thiocytidine biosynthesis protein TtcA